MIILTKIFYLFVFDGDWSPTINVKFKTLGFNSVLSSAGIDIKPFSPRYPSSPDAESLRNSSTYSCIPGTTPTCAFFIFYNNGLDIAYLPPAILSKDGSIPFIIDP